jgi:DNA end-binding protein Ku
MAIRANWKGFLTLGEISCAVSLYTAASTSERIAFHMLNRKTGNRLHRQFVDEQTRKPVEAADQVKGFETESGDYIILDPDEIASAIPDSDKALEVEAFIPCGEVDDLYFDRPYYLAPTTGSDDEAFDLLRDAMRSQKMAAIARAVLFRRMRSVLIRPFGNGLIGTTLNFDYEIRSATDAFKDIPAVKMTAEMLDLARHIIQTKAGKFEPASFDDRYEAALAELVKAKLEGRKIKPAKPAAQAKVVDLMDALRQSAAATKPKQALPKRKAS